MLLGATLQQVGGQQVVARGPFMYGPRGFVDLKILISEFSQHFENLKDLNQVDLNERMYLST